MATQADKEAVAKNNLDKPREVTDSVLIDDKVDTEEDEDAQNHGLQPRYQD